MTDRLDELIPRLRRYAGILCADRDRGDALVEAALRAVTAESLSGGPRGLDIALFALLNRLWTRVAPPDGRPDGALPMLGGLTPLQRQLVLMTKLERFPLEEAACALGLPLRQAERHLERAVAAMLVFERARVFIIEDEWLLADALAGIVQEMGHEVSGIAATAAEALSGGAADADLIIADLRLRDGSSGMRAATALRGERHVPVIYVTGFPECVAPCAVHPGDLVVDKPFRPDQIRSSLQQALAFRLEQSRLVH